MRRSTEMLDRNVATDPKTVLFASDGPVAVVNADFDGDGKLDLAVLDVSSRQITILKGDGRGGFCPPADLPTLERRRDVRRSPERLTARETDVAKLLSSGYMDREIAKILGIGRRTVETHTANIRAKLGLKSRRELVHAGVWPVA